MGVESTIGNIASRQLGLITRRQAEEAGMSGGVIDHRLRTGRWEPTRRGVFRVNGSPRTREQAILAACLAGGDKAVASHLTAVEVWRLRDTPSPRIEITVPTSRRFRSKDLVVHQADLSRKDITRRA